MSYNHQTRNCRVWLLLGFFVMLILQLFRILHGIDITDEAFYVAEPISVLRGNIPYTYNMISVSGASFLVLPILWAYQHFVPSLEGVMLFSRCAFLLFRVLILTAVYLLLRRKHNRVVLAAGMIGMLGFWAADIHNFSYNTISPWLFLLTSAIQLAAFESGEAGKKRNSAILSGILAAFSELAHPAEFLNVLFFGISILLFSDERRWKELLLYLGAGLCTTAAVFSSIILMGGWRPFLFGVDSLLHYGGLQASLPLSEALRIFLRVYPEDLILAAAAMAVFGAAQLLRKGADHAERGGLADAAARVDLHSVSALLLLIGIGRILTLDDKCDVSMHLGLALCLAAFLLWFQSFFGSDRKRFMAITMFAAPPMLWFAVNGFFSSNGPLGRMTALCMVFPAILMACEPELTERKRFRGFLAGAALFGTVLLSVYGQYVYFYREGELSQLNCRVESGVYKDLYTEPKKALAIAELEEYINSITDRSESVLFLDTVPMAYLMTEADPWTPSTWDRMQYTYYRSGKLLNPESAYLITERYFSTREACPDKIIYIDFGRDPQLSVEDGSYPFNSFVNGKYDRKEEKGLNDWFRVLLFEKKEE